jgi:GDP-4-dehydro-6-deoxy-D-mannose reductase
VIAASTRVLVTGASGFIGGELARAGIALGWDVFAVGHTRERGSPSMRRVDLTAPGEVDALIQEVAPAVVFHLAAASAGTGTAPDETLDAELRMLDNLARALARSKPEPVLVMTGSAAEYGDPERERIDEETPLAPANSYGAAKVALERAALARELPVVWLRTFNVLGPGQPRGHPVSDWTWRLLECERERGGELRTGRLDLVRDYLDVRDVADAIVAAAGLEPATVANVCSGTPTRLLDLVERLTALVDVPIEVVPEAPTPGGPPARVVGDPSRFHALTGWKSRVSVEQSLRDGLDWARSNALASVR